MVHSRAASRGMRILHVEDSEDDAELVRLTLTREWPDCAVCCVGSRPAFISELSRGRFDVILCDFALATLNGFEALEIAKERTPDTPFIFLSGSIGEERAIETLRAGAADYVLKDRMERLTAAISRALDERGAPKARLCINSDITGGRRLEEQFLRAQRMETIGLLAAGIAHDLNNMLAPILLAAPMLREHVTDPGAIGLLGTLEKSAERGANLVQQILAVAHGTADDLRPVEVRHLLRDISSVIAGTFPKSITLEDDIPADLWPIRGNATQVHQVLLNLSVNARDAMPDGGTLRLHAENIVLDPAAAGALEGARPGAFVVLHVEDTGTGIAPEMLGRMWEPFFTTKATGKGTGLGLSTVRGIVEKHGGFIEVRSALGRGSCFRVHLPAEEAGPGENASAQPQPSPAGRGELILVVDDERHICDLTLTMLTRRGYRVLLAADGAEAVRVFAQCASEIRLVITDLHMPNLDGAMLGSALRRINPAIKLLAMSGMPASLSSRPDFQPEEFADAFLPKPFKPDTLLAKVHELLRK
jgi:two-component system, cell cycle sensor histidine kinase and response regulator CckA